MEDRAGFIQQRQLGTWSSSTAISLAKSPTVWLSYLNILPLLSDQESGVAKYHYIACLDFTVTNTA